MAYWATPFTCTLTFAHSFAKLSRKYPYYLQTPAISTGASEEKQTPGALVFGSRKASLVKIGWCIWSLFLGTSESNVTQYQPQVQGCASRSWYLIIWLWRSLTFGSLAATYEGKSKCAVPFSCRTPGGRRCLPLTSCDVDNDA